MEPSSLGSSQDQAASPWPFLGLIFYSDSAKTQETSCGRMEATQTWLPCVSVSPCLPFQKPVSGPGRLAGLRNGLLKRSVRGERGVGLVPPLAQGGFKVQPGTPPSCDAHTESVGSAGAPWLLPHPTSPRLAASAPLCGHLGVSRPWGWLPSGDSILALLTVEQVPLEKARKVTVIQQDSQDHPWGRRVSDHRAQRAHCNPGHPHPEPL